MHIHAQLIIAPSVAAAVLPEELQVPSVDVQHITASQFGINDARRLIHAAATRAVQRPHRSFVIACDTITGEAQHALLKLFEDPPQLVQFALIVSHESLIMPTLRSRFVDVVVCDAAATNDAAAAFIQMSYADRLAHIAALHTAKKTHEMETLANDLGVHVLQQKTTNAALLREATFVESNIRIKGGSRKMLLEHLALTIPVPA